MASGKGGVGKSTVAGERRDAAAFNLFLLLDSNPLQLVVNLAFSLALLRNSSSSRRLRVGILDLDIFGPSIPTLMGLQYSEEPRLTPCMLYLKLRTSPDSWNHIIILSWCNNPSNEP